MGETTRQENVDPISTYPCPSDRAGGKEVQGNPCLWDVVSSLRALGFLGSGHLSCQLGIAGSVEKVPVEPGRDSRL